jgi:hypothetical protein
MRITEIEPTSGQYIVIWDYNGNLWSETVKIKNDKRLVYNNKEGEFESPNYEHNTSIKRYYLIDDYEDEEI